MIALRPLKHTPDELTVIEAIVPKIWIERGQHILQNFRDEFEKGAMEGEQNYLVEVAGQPLGVTGFYRFDESRLGLCWHGILPEYRRSGLGTVVFGMLKRQARMAHPSIKTIVELIPADRKAELEAYFVDCLGFRATRFVIDPDTCPWPWITKDVEWRVYEGILN